MTLFNQINSLLFGLFLLVMSSLVYFQFTETREFMSNQMQSDLNNASTSLSLMLKPHLETGDEVTVETLVNVIFEGGFYQKINLTWLADNKEQIWNNPVAVEGVPQWFLDLDLFQAQNKEIIITSGWLQLATLKIESNPAIGYLELWRIMNDTLMVLATLFLISIGLLRIRLKAILKPLHDVAVHAGDIALRKFAPDMPLPKTTELKGLVSAVNSMSGQLKLVFSALDDEVSSLKNDKLFDTVSHLPNRQYLTGQLNSWLDEPGFGALLLADFEWLDEIHSKFGFQVRDETIKVLAKKLQTALPADVEAIIARISNTEFAFLITHGDKPQITKYLQSLIRLINQEMLNADCQPNSGFAIGISERTEGISRVELLSQADNALQIALNENKRSAWFYIKEQQEFSREEWRERLTKAISNNQFIFLWQPVHNSDTGAVIQREIYSSLEIEGKTVKAGQFMPYIERLSLGAQLDRYLLESIIKEQITDINSEPVAINLTRESLANLEFHSWLQNYLTEINCPEKLHFELPESGINSHLDNCIKLAEIIKSSGAQFGIDNCGRQMGSLDYLQKLKPYYIKLDLSLSCYNSEDQEDNQQNLELCRALVNIARGLDIKVIITGIEDEKHLHTVKSLRTDGYQGYIYPPVDI